MALLVKNLSEKIIVNFCKLIPKCHWETIFRLCYFKTTVTTQYWKQSLL